MLITIAHLSKKGGLIQSDQYVACSVLKNFDTFWHELCKLQLLCQGKYLQKISVAIQMRPSAELPTLMENLQSAPTSNFVMEVDIARKYIGTYAFR